MEVACYVLAFSEGAIACASERAEWDGGVSRGHPNEFEGTGDGPGLGKLYEGASLIEQRSLLKSTSRTAS